MKNLPLSDSMLESLLTYLAGKDSFVFLETVRCTSEDHRTLLFLDQVDRLILRQGDSPLSFFRQAESFMNKGYYLAGWFSYEFGYTLEPVLGRGDASDPDRILADLGIFRSPHIYDHQTGTFSGAGPWPVTVDDGIDRAYRVGNVRLNETREEYCEKIRRIKGYIEAGDTYQVNYTLKLLFELSGSSESFYRALRRNQSVSFGAYIRSGPRRIMSFSPELFFRKTGDSCVVRPMKGTIRRGRTVGEDHAIASSLRADIKNRSENIMIVDLLRNDLGRLSRMGEVSVRSLFDVEAFETLHQMTSTVEGRLRPGVSLLELFSALFPCGSVTGAPKIRTMEIIRELEQEARGVYTGGIGYISPSGDAVFNVPIRTVVLDGGKGEMGIGSGIVYDSEPDAEWNECRLKGQFLTDLPKDFQLIETMLWRPEKGYWLLDLHVKRLLDSAGYFGFPADEGTLREKLRVTEQEFSSSAKRVRLLLFRNGDLEMTASSCSLPDENIFPVTEQEVSELPCCVLSDKRTDAQSAYLFHKTTRRDLYEQERVRWQAKGFFEVLFRNLEGEVTEGSFTNIFVGKGGRLFTPPVSCGLLGGVFRQYLLENHPDMIQEKVLTLKDIEDADAVYVGNSVRGLVRVALGLCL